MSEESLNLGSLNHEMGSNLEKERIRTLIAQRFDEALSQVSFTHSVHPDTGRNHPGLCEDEGFKYANKTDYMYTPLEFDKKQIHLLVFGPAEEWEEPIQCSLFAEPLDSLPLSFEILSYCWGDPLGTIPIYIYDRVHYITANLASFLRCRRSPSLPTVLWIDALCINQSDNKEKGQQVGIMRLIYERATILHIWLGDESSDSNLAMDLIRQLGRPGEETQKVWVMSDEEMFALENLFERSWWKRIWIIQELVNGGDNQDMKTRIVRCGLTALPWDYISRAISRLNKQNEDIRQHFRNLEPILGLELARKGHISPHATKSSHLLHLLELHRGRDATDSRDRVYGLMGLANSEETIYRGINVDYGRPAAQLFADIALSAIKASNSLDILRRCHKGGIAKVPSWAPDWSITCKYRPLRTRHTVFAREIEEVVVEGTTAKHGEEGDNGADEGEATIDKVDIVEGDELAEDASNKFYSAAGFSTPEFEISEDKTVLGVKGLLFDRIKFPSF